MSRPTLMRTAAVLLVLGLVTIAAWHAVAQPQGPPPQGGGVFPGGPMMFGPPMNIPGPAPVPVVVVGEGVVYVACDGRLMAFDAKTLQKVAEATYWERPELKPLGPGPQ